MSSSYTVPFIFNAIIYTLSVPVLYLVLVVKRRANVAMEITVSADAGFVKEPMIA
jgi:hypothetical protein